MDKNDFINIDIRELLYLLLKKWYLIVLCFVLSTSSAFLITQYYLKPVYTAETTLFLGKERQKVDFSFADIQVNNQLVADYRELLMSRTVAEEIEKKLGVPISVFQGNVSVKTVKDSRIFSISYADTDKERAANVTNELATIIQQLAKEIIEVNNVQVIDTAKVPNKPVKPNKKMNVSVAGVLGLLSGAMLIYILEYVDHTFKKPEDVEGQLGLNVIGTIPLFEGGKRGKRKSKDEKVLEKQYLKNLITQNNPKAPATEAFRELRTNLQYAAVDKELKTIVVTSPTMGDGKTVTAVNLAVTLSRSGSKVLIIDADLRKPKVHLYFGVDNKEGLTNVLTSDKDRSKINTIEYDKNTNLQILTSGPVPPNAAEILNSKRMIQLLEKLKEEYDIIIIDTPPIGQVTDAAILAGVTDGTILVLASNETRIEITKRAKKALDSVNASITGVVLTKIDNKRISYYSYSYKYD
jgi:capsular exopolysaccharide synthesis family protein